MRLDYWTQISPDPITLSVGTLYKPRLNDISKIGFGRFRYFEFLMKLTPETYYTELVEDKRDYWENLADDKKSKITLFTLINQDENLQKSYVDLLDFFFLESVIYRDGYFIFIKQGLNPCEYISSNMIHSVLSGEKPEVFLQVLEVIQQICGIYSEEESIENIKFKNKTARKLYERMLKARQEEEKMKKADKNMSLPNIISALSSKHPSLNYLNIWDLTVYQLLDSFNRVQTNTIYDIDSTRVSVWGDEKKTFNAALWYKNHYDK